MLEDFGLFLVAMVGIVVVVGGAIFGGITIYRLNFDQPACAAFGKLSGLETYYSLGTDCIVKSGGVWVNYSVVTGNQQQITIKSK